MAGWVVFGKVVRSVEFAGSPVEVELSLGDGILQPMITHIKCFGFLHADLRM
jgi:hypothetical protein